MTANYTVPGLGRVLFGSADALLQDPTVFFESVRREESLSELTLFGRRVFLLNHPNYMSAFLPGSGKGVHLPAHGRWDLGGERLFGGEGLTANEISGVPGILSRFVDADLVKDATFVEWFDTVLRLLPGLEREWLGQGLLDSAWEGVDALHVESLGVSGIPGWVPLPSRVLGRLALAKVPAEALPLVRLAAALRVGLALAWFASSQEDVGAAAGLWREDVMAELDVTQPLDRLFLETARRYPPAWWCVRAVKERMSVAGIEIAAGTVVVASMLQTGRDSRFFDRPLTFNSDRWLGHSEQHLNEAIMFPFGFGGWERPAVVAARAMFRTGLLWMGRHRREVVGRSKPLLGAWIVPAEGAVLGISPTD